MISPLPRGRLFALFLRALRNHVAVIHPVQIHRVVRGGGIARGDGVGHIAPDSEHEQPLSLVRRSKCRSWNDARPHFVSFRFQTGYDGWQGEIARSTHILSKDVSGSKLTNNSEHLVPEAGALPRQSPLLARD